MKRIGRPRQNPRHLRVLISMRLEPRTLDSLKKEADALDMSIGQLVDFVTRKVLG